MASTLTLQEMTDLTREIMNAAGSGQWSDTILQRWVGIAHWAEWADLLAVNMQYQMQTVNVTQDASGQFALTSLNTGSGDSKKYWFRILSVAQPGAPSSTIQYFYREAKYRQYPNPQPNTSLPYVWYRFGSNVQILPVAAGLSMAVTTSYRPPRADWLSSASVTVDFPEGYADVIPWRAAVLALVKGGSEVQAARDITAQWQIQHDAMLQDLGRSSVWPITAESFDDPSMWGG